MTYDYKCDSCSHEFEAKHKMSDPRPPCHECGAKVSRHFRSSGPSVSFKGNGWTGQQLTKR